MNEIKWVENTVVYEKHPPASPPPPLLGSHEQAVLKQHCFQEGTTGGELQPAGMARG